MESNPGALYHSARPGAANEPAAKRVGKACCKHPDTGSNTGFNTGAGNLAAFVITRARRAADNAGKHIARSLALIFVLVQFGHPKRWRSHLALANSG